MLYFFFVFVVLQQFVKTNQQSCSCRPLTDNKMAAVNMAVVAMLLSYFVIYPWKHRGVVIRGVGETT